MVRNKIKAKVIPLSIAFKQPKILRFYSKISIVFLAIIFSSTFVQAQESDSLAFREKAATLKYLRSLASVEQDKCDKSRFFSEYQIDLTSSKEAKVLSDIYFKTGPGNEFKDCKLAIPEGSVVKLYKYFEEEQFWAAKFDNKWGFLHDSQVKSFD